MGEYVEDESDYAEEGAQPPQTGQNYIPEDQIEYLNKLMETEWRGDDLGRDVVLTDIKEDKKEMLHHLANVSMGLKEFKERFEKEGIEASELDNIINFFNAQYKREIVLCRGVGGRTLDAIRSFTTKQKVEQDYTQYVANKKKGHTPQRLKGWW